MHDLTRLLRGTFAASILAGTLGVFAGAATASVPGKDFTKTACEEYSDSIARLYSAGLNREAEQGGFDFWLHQYSTGQRTFGQIAEYFVTSPEFQASHGLLTNEQFVRQLYLNVLNREGEDEGVDHWTQGLDEGVTRARLLMLLAESPENITRTGTRLPTLGVFNVGLPEGAWRCGPGLQGALLQLDDLGGAWRRHGHSLLPEDAPCQDFLAAPVGSQLSRLDSDDGSQAVVHWVHSFATEYGAKEFMDRSRANVLVCPDFDRNGSSIVLTVEKTQMRSQGDQSIAFRTSYDVGGSTLVEMYTVIARFGNAISIVEISMSGHAAVETAEIYVALTSERVTVARDG